GSTPPELREALRDLGPSEHQDKERLPRKPGQHDIDQLDRQRIAPMQIFQHEDDGRYGALGLQPIQKCPLNLLAHGLWIAARRLKRRAGFGWKENPAELAQKFADPAPVQSAYMTAQILRERGPLPGRVIAVLNPGMTPQRLAQHPVGRSGAQGIG